MIVPKSRGFVPFLIALAFFFGLSVSLMPEAISGQKGKYKGYSKKSKQKNYGTYPTGAGKTYNKKQDISGKDLKGKNSVKLTHKPGTGPEVNRNSGQSPENPELTESKTAD